MPPYATAPFSTQPGREPGRGARRARARRPKPAPIVAATSGSLSRTSPAAPWACASRSRRRTWFSASNGRSAPGIADCGRHDAVLASEGSDELIAHGRAEQRHACSERRAYSPSRAAIACAIASSGKGSPAPTQTHVRREHIRDRGGLREADVDGDRRYARTPGAPQHSDVLIAGSHCENVHVHVGAFRIAQPDGSGLRMAAQELLPQLGRELVGPADRENMIVRSRGRDLLHQLRGSPRPRPEEPLSGAASSATRGRARGSRAARPSPRGSRSTRSRRR